MWRGGRIYIRLWLYWHVSKLNCDYIHLQITLKFFIFVISLHIRGVCLQNCISKSFYVYSFIWFFGFSQIHMRFFFPTLCFCTILPVYITIPSSLCLCSLCHGTLCVCFVCKALWCLSDLCVDWSLAMMG